MSNKKTRTKVTAGATRKKPQYSESQLQSGFFKWFRLQYPGRIYECFAIPNGGKRDIITASRMKKEGATAGVWDVLVMNNDICNTSRGLFIEFKVGKNKLTENQQAFREANFNYDFAVCYTLEEAVSVVNAYLNND